MLAATNALRQGIENHFQWPSRVGSNQVCQRLYDISATERSKFHVQGPNALAAVFAYSDRLIREGVPRIPVTELEFGLSSHCPETSLFQLHR